MTEQPRTGALRQGLLNAEVIVVKPFEMWTTLFAAPIS